MAYVFEVRVGGCTGWCVGLGIRLGWVFVELGGRVRDRVRGVVESWGEI